MAAPAIYLEAPPLTATVAVSDFLNIKGLFPIEREASPEMLARLESGDQLGRDELQNTIRREGGARHLTDL